MTREAFDARTRQAGLWSAAALAVGSFLSAVAPLVGAAAVGPVVVASLVSSGVGLALSVWAFVRLLRGPRRTRRRR
jgi:hypothetical protein